MAVQVVRVLRADDSVRHVRLRDDATPEQVVVIEPASWVDLIQRVQRGDFDHHLPVSWDRTLTEIELGGP